MTVKRIIDGLYFTVGMMLFDPMTGESKTPDGLNEDDRTTYDACMGAINLLKAQEPVEPYRDSEGTFYCSTCMETVVGYKNVNTNEDIRLKNYCSECGRAVKWDD